MFVPAEGEAVIPSTNAIAFVREAIFHQRRIHLVLCEAKGSAKLQGRGRDNLKIVEVGEYRFTTRACYAGDKTASQGRVCLECGVHKISHELGRLVPEATNPGALHRCIILVEKYNRTHPPIPFEQRAEKVWYRGTSRGVHIETYRIKPVAIEPVETLPAEQVCVSFDCVNHQLIDPLHHRFEAALFHTRKAQRHHGHRTLQCTHSRVAPHVHPAKEFLTAPSEIRGKEAANGVEVERFSESSGATDKGNGVISLPPVAYEAGLVHVKVTLRAQGLVSLRPYAYRPRHPPLVSSSCYSIAPLINEQQYAPRPRDTELFWERVHTSQQAIGKLLP